jgi:hypothetical protein
MNSGSKVVKYNRYTTEQIECSTPSGPRSMTLSANEDYLYVVNYLDHSFSKIRTADMALIETIATSDKPIGICGNWDESEIWVACYSGKIEVFKDFHLDSLKNGNSIFGFDLSNFWKPKTTAEKLNDSLTAEINADTLVADRAGLVKKIIIIPKTSLLDATIKNTDRFKDREVSDSSADCLYYVICGAFSIPENADKRIKELNGNGYQCEVIVGAKLTYVAPLCSDNRSSAEDQMKLLKEKEGFSAWILKR